MKFFHYFHCNVHFFYITNKFSYIFFLSLTSNSNLFSLIHYAKNFYLEQLDHLNILVNILVITGKSLIAYFLSLTNIKLKAIFEIIDKWSKKFLKLMINDLKFLNNRKKFLALCIKIISGKIFKETLKLTISVSNEQFKNTST